MSKFKIWKKGLVVVFSVWVLGWASAASAVIINGTFTLVADIAANPFSGQTIVKGTYQVDTSINPVLNPYVDGFGNSFDFATTLTSLTLTDQTGSFGSFTEADFVFPQPVAILSDNGPSPSVVALYGEGAQGATSISLTFDEANNIQGTFTTSNAANAGITTIAVSGNQYIPEPGALALMGAGFLAFGFARSRRT